MIANIQKNLHRLSLQIVSMYRPVALATLCVLPVCLSVRLSRQAPNMTRHETNRNDATFSRQK